MKSKAARKGAVEGGGGIVVEATNRKARRKEQRLAKKKQHQTSKPRAPPAAAVSTDNDHTDNNNSKKKKKKRDTARLDEDRSSNKKRVKFSNSVQETTIPSVKNVIPTGLKRSSKKSSSTKPQEEDDYHHPNTTTTTTTTSINYQNLDDETAAAFRRDEMEIQYLESNLGIKSSHKKNKKDTKKELNREYAKNEGFGEDFGDFLMGLDDLVERCVGDGGDGDGGDDVSGEDDEDDGGSDASDNDNDKSNNFNKSGSRIIDSDDNDDDDFNNKDQDPYTNLDEETALAFRSDDAEIAALESKLGLATSKKARRKLNKEFASTFQGYGEDFGDFLNDLDELGEKISLGGTAGGGDYSSEEDGEEGSLGSNELMDLDEDSEGGNKNPSSDNNESSSNDESDSEEEDAADIADHDVALTYRPTSEEDIYGNRIDSSNSEAVKPTKYVPPHLRKKMEQEAAAADDGAIESDTNKATAISSNTAAAATADPETIKHIQRSLNNTLNRLSTNTLESVSKSISSLYSQYPFHDMNDCLWKNVQSACVPPHMVMTGLIPLYIGVMAGVHWGSGDGIQLGGCLVEWSVVRLFQSLERGRKKNNKLGGNAQMEDEEESENHEMINKEASNLLLIVCYLYNYGVIHCTLTYDLIRNFISNFTEIDVEALLIILSHCGQQLRSDDPSALREIVLLVKDRAQKAAAAEGGDDTGAASADSSRIQYMVDTIMELKNNKPRKQDVVLREKTNVLKKCIGRVKSSTSSNSSLSGKKSGSCLRVTLQDVLDADTKGRWWMVGASWAGNQHSDKLWGSSHENDAEEEEDGQQQRHPTSNKSKKPTNEDSMLALASSQRMNTDARRSIFCIVMGSTDCDDAFEKLVRQGLLKPKAERDVIRVLVHCCGEEKAFNPFYAFLAVRVCEYQAKSRFTLMLTFWDVFKQLETFSIRKVANLAKLLAHLIGGGGGKDSNNSNNKQCLTIGVLKRIEFSPSDMPEMVVLFLSIFMTAIFETCDVLDIQKIFARGVNNDSSSSAARKRQVESDSDEDDDDVFGSSKVQTTKKEDLSDMRESLSLFVLQYLKSSSLKNVNESYEESLNACIAALE